jgi:hypothetical protein
MVRPTWAKLLCDKVAKHLAQAWPGLGKIDSPKELGSSLDQLQQRVGEVAVETDLGL